MKITHTAFVRNRVLFLYSGKDWVRLNLVTMEYHSYGNETETTALRIQASALKTWLLEDRGTFELILKPGKSEPPHLRRTLPPVSVKPMSLRRGLDAMLKDLLSKKKEVTS